MKDILTEHLRGFDIKFKTKPGVFSEHGLDTGTRLLIDNFKIEDGTLIADLGSGTGVVGFICAKLDPKGHIHLLDDHLRSVELAKENIELNNLNNTEVFLSDLFSAVPDRTYHQIFSNPPQQLGNGFLKELILQSCKHLKPKGRLWLVIKSNLKNPVVKMLDQVFSNSQVIAQDKGHIILVAEKIKAKSDILLS
ncbi:MAG: methyltransferase [Candidatus Daviesbacteria bacterium]